jgi:hypothetical protein
MRVRARLALVAVASVMTGCASSGATETASDPFGGEGVRASSVRLIVQNLNFSDARLYAMTRGGRRSIGIVGGKATEEFTLDWTTPESLQIEINLLAGPRCYTRAMEVDPGDVLELQIASVFTQTSACR